MSYLCEQTDFNREQYEVEHSDPDTHLLVTAGAGTGKTTVLIDCLLYLCHCDPDFTFDSTVMITFTNMAALEMRKRLAKRLMTYYEVTRNPRYLTWLDESQDLFLSTIHAFAKTLLEKAGTAAGIPGEIRLHSYRKQKMVAKDLKLKTASLTWLKHSILLQKEEGHLTPAGASYLLHALLVHHCSDRAWKRLIPFQLFYTLAYGRGDITVSWIEGWNEHDGPSSGWNCSPCCTEIKERDRTGRSRSGFPPGRNRRIEVGGRPTSGTSPFASRFRCVLDRSGCMSPHFSDRFSGAFAGLCPGFSPADRLPPSDRCLPSRRTGRRGFGSTSFRCFPNGLPPSKTTWSVPTGSEICGSTGLIRIWFILRRWKPFNASAASRSVANSGMLTGKSVCGRRSG
ncbi:hypothetical protein CHM34_12945 [Paludifilum halophilum]|uniref:UvrD-like helicase ATP-binding domain-containing protein n=1 Tax=Paludifilum halophilum TaxID=1642702 RepID=A0A235B4P4_9BACL|nr:hypothetical protein CHM34_12945 [Paludifilum halophilum]